MNLQQLEYIIALDRLKSFSKAADYCHVTQATLSAMVKKLEEELGIVIFDRKTSPVITTEQGLNVVREALKIVHHSRQLKELAAKSQNTLEGRVRIGIIPTIANALLQIILKPLLERYPQLRIEIQELTTPQLIAQLKSGNVDIGIAATPLNHDDIEEHIMYYEPLLLYGETSGDKAYLSPDDIREQHIWLLEEGHCLREQTIELCSLKQKNPSPANLNFEANSLETLLSMVDIFGGLTLLPELYSHTLPPAKRDKIRPFRTPIPVREVSIIYFRPFAKHHLIETVSRDITQLVSSRLSTQQYRKSELLISKFS